MALQLAVLAFFSVMAYWTKNVVIYLGCGALSLFTGLYWYDTFTNNLGLTIGVILIIYWLVCWSLGVQSMFARDTE